MTIYVIPPTPKRQKPNFPTKARTPYFTLERDNWNDHGYSTLFFLRFHGTRSDHIDVGPVKILHISDKKTELPSRFQRLPADFCSLGQSEDYYNELLTLGDIFGNGILESLNDIIFRPLLAESFRKLEGFEKSLLRDPYAKKILKNGKRLFDKKASRIRDYEFTFECRLKGALKAHKVGFNFKKRGDLPHRLMVLIGKNGTGKTQILAEMANALSGRSSGKRFKPTRPNYSRVFAVSYSLFDKFHRVDKDQSYGYLYCGLRTKNGYADDKEFVSNLSQSLAEIKRLKRIPEWKTVVEPIIPNISKLVSIRRTLKALDLQKMSSGQIMTLATLTDIVSNIQPDSLLLFDEPETHLHPNAISNLMKSLYLLLESFNSYAIISTHSPIVLQEVPSKCVQIFAREGNYPVVRPLEIESFGENLTTLTHEVFGVDVSDSLYKTVLANMASKQSIESILNYFNNNLSLNARIFLETVHHNITIES